MSKNLFGGFVLAVLFLVAANVRADVVSGSDIFTAGNEIFGFTVNRGNGNGDFSVEKLVGLTNQELNYVKAGTGNAGFELTVTLSNGVGGNEYLGFTLQQTTVSGNLDSWFETMTIGGQTAGSESGWDLLKSEEGYYYFTFSDIAALLNGNDQLVFWIGNNQNIGVGDYTFTFYGGQVKDAVPEPTTLAVLGFGLAGLGIAVHRRQK